MAYSLDERCIWHHDPPCRAYPKDEDCQTDEEQYYCRIWTSIGAWMLMGIGIQGITGMLLLFALHDKTGSYRHSRKALFALLVVDCLILLYVVDFFVSASSTVPAFRDSLHHG